MRSGMPTSQNRPNDCATSTSTVPPPSSTARRESANERLPETSQKRVSCGPSVRSDLPQHHAGDDRRDLLEADHADRLVDRVALPRQAIGRRIDDAQHRRGERDVARDEAGDALEVGVLLGDLRLAGRSASPAAAGCPCCGPARRPRRRRSGRGDGRARRGRRWRGGGHWRGLRAVSPFRHPPRRD